jgi:hypothetical protein
MTTIQAQILQLTTIQNVIQALPKGVYGIDTERVHLGESYFLELFRGKPFEVENRLDTTYPFEYVAYAFGTKFIAISRQNNLMPKPTYPVEQLANELVSEWGKYVNPEQKVVFYADGRYTLNYRSTALGEIIYTYEQLMNEESVTLEQAILDHMEVEYDESKQ